MAENDLGPEYYGTVILVEDRYVDIKNTETIIADGTSYKYKFVIITELYDSDLKKYLSEKSLLQFDLSDTLNKISDLILTSLDHYVCTDIKFNNMLIKKEPLKIVLNDFDGVSPLDNSFFCRKIVTTITETETETEPKTETKTETETNKNNLHMLILLLLCMSSFEILVENIKKNINDYIYNVKKIELFYYNILKEYFSNHKKEFIDFVASVYSAKKFMNINYEILKFIHILKISENVNFNCKEFTDLSIIYQLVNCKLDFTEIIGNLIDFLFFDIQQGGNIEQKTVDFADFDKQETIGEGAYGKIYEKEGKIYKIINQR